MATRIRAAGRFANHVGSDSDSDLGGMESYPRKRQSSIARSMGSNRITKLAPKVAGSIDRSAPRRLSPGRRPLTDKSNLNATRPSHKSRDEKPLRPVHDEDFDDDSMLLSHQSKEGRKKQRLEDSRPVKQSVATTKRYTSSSPRHAARHFPVEAAAELEEEDDDMDMVDVVGQKEEEEMMAIPKSRRAAAQVLPPARPTSRSQSSQGEDASLDRRLREMTRRYENLEGRYTELREVGVQSAERNYEKLRKQADENATSEFPTSYEWFHAQNALTKHQLQTNSSRN